MELTNNIDMRSLLARVHNWDETVAQSAKCIIGACKLEFNPPECTLKKPDLVACTCDPRTGEAETGGSLGLTNQELW